MFITKIQVWQCGRTHNVLPQICCRVLRNDEGFFFGKNINFLEPYDPNFFCHVLNNSDSFPFFKSKVSFFTVKGNCRP